MTEDINQDEKQTEADRKQEAKAEKKRIQNEKRAEKQASLRRFAVRIICFTVLTGSIILYGLYVLTPKNEYGICPMINLYSQPKDSVDVLVIGSSLAYAGCNTNVLWRAYGIASYNLCGAEEPFWSTYYELKEGLRYQRPKLILLDAKAASYTVDYSKRGRVIQATYGILHPDYRIGGICAAVESSQDALGFVLGYPQVHYNYRDLTPEHFAFPPTNEGRGSSWKGFIEIDLTEQHSEYDIALTTQKKKMKPRAEEYVRKIFDLVQEENIPLAVVAFPNPDYGHDHPYYMSLFEIADEYGIQCLNYNSMYGTIGLDFSKDFADWQHLNVGGGIKMSLKLGYDLVHDFGIPDRRGDPVYDSYEECAEIWFAKMYDFKTSPAEGAYSMYGL